MAHTFVLEVDQDPTQDVFADALGRVAQGSLVPEGGQHGRQIIHVRLGHESLSDAVAYAIDCVQGVGLGVIGISAIEHVQ